VDKAKLYAAAEKFISKGQNEKALEALEQILSVDSQDMKALSKASDLYLKVGSTPKAVECLRRISDVYTRDGFYSKAVAILKRVLKINEGGSRADTIRIHEQLANLYSQLGLVSDAMSHYKIVVDFFDQTKDKPALLEVLKRVAELDPYNPDSQMKLIELFVGEGREEEARSSLRKLADSLSTKGQWADVIQVYEKWTGLFPKDFKSLEYLVRIYLKVGEPKRALGRLQQAFRTDPYNTAVLELLSKTFTEMKQPDKARAVDVELVKLYRKNGDDKNLLLVEERVRGGAPISTATGSQARSSMQIKSESIDPGDDLISKAQIDTEERKIISECDVYMKYGLAEKAREVLAAQIHRFPKSLALRWKLKGVLQELRLREELVHCLSEIVLLAKEQKSAEWIKLSADELRSVDPKHPSLDSAPMDIGIPAHVSDEPTQRSKLNETAQEVFGEDLDDSDISIIVEDDLISKSQPQPEFVKEGIMDDDDELLEEAERASHKKEKVQKSDDVLEDYLLLQDETKSAGEEVVEEESGSETIELADMMSFADAEDKAAAGGEDSDGFLLSEADFTSDELNQFAQNIDPEQKAAEASEVFDIDEPTVSAVSLMPVDDEVSRVAEIALAEVAVIETKAPPASESKAPSGASNAKQVEVEALGTKMKFSVQEDLRSELEEDFFDLAAELEDELTTKSSVPAEVRDVFNAFKQGVSSSVSADDFETHFDLGIAYREMGLIEDAIAEFQLCADMPGKNVTSQYQLGLCEVARGNWANAREHFDVALKTPKLDNQEKISLSYELAEVLMKLEDKKRAAELYEDVQKLDPTFRDVADRIKALRA